MKHFFETLIDIQIKTYDIDFAGVVSNIVYVRWLEDLRLAMLAKHYPLDEQLERGFAPAVIQTQIDYKRALSLFEPIHGRVWVADIQKIKWVLKYEIIHEQGIAASAEQTGLFVGLSRKRPVAIPDELRLNYTTWLDKKSA